MAKTKLRILLPIILFLFLIIGIILYAINNKSTRNTTSTHSSSVTEVPINKNEKILTDVKESIQRIINEAEEKADSFINNADVLFNLPKQKIAQGINKSGTDTIYKISPTDDNYIYYCAFNQDDKLVFEKKIDKNGKGFYVIYGGDFLWEYGEFTENGKVLDGWSIAITIDEKKTYVFKYKKGTIKESFLLNEDGNLEQLKGYIGRHIGGTIDFYNAASSS